LRELNRRGFRSKKGKPITKSCLEGLLANPFYCGRIVLKQDGRSYKGIHQPIISERSFRRVTARKTDRQIKCHTRHNHTFRKSIKCGLCGWSFVGELQKGHVYMRCQQKDCPTRSIRADQIDAEVKMALFGVRLSDCQAEKLHARALALLEQSSAMPQQTRHCESLMATRMSRKN
jgi:site-specific DNA recombinase